MINKLMQIIAPHYCCGCAKVGTVLCDNCEYDIIDESADMCIVCAGPSSAGICGDCHTTYDRAWFVGDRSGTLERVIDIFKFERASDAAVPLANLLHQRLPLLPADTVVVPVPTIASHVRQRGYDHTALLASRFAQKRALEFTQILRRNDTNVQRGKHKKERFDQAKHVFSCNAVLDRERTYLVIDDITTTNATVRFAAAELQRAGAMRVWVAVLARQPLDKRT